MKRAVVQGQEVELRSAESNAVTVEVKDVFPPKAPTGLAAAEPARAADGSYALDLSWEANTEADLSG